MEQVVCLGTKRSTHAQTKYQRMQHPVHVQKDHQGGLALASVLTVAHCGVHGTTQQTHYAAPGTVVSMEQHNKHTTPPQARCPEINVPVGWFLAVPTLLAK